MKRNPFKHTIPLKTGASLYSSFMSLLLLLTLMISLGCNNNQTADKKPTDRFDILKGNWISNLKSNDNIITFTKADTVILGTFKIVVYSSNYSSGQVLFRDIHFVSDTSFLCKGLYVKPVYNTYTIKKPTIFNWGGDDGHGNIYVEEKKFDHFDKQYVDYRAEIIRIHSPYKGYRIDLTPFSDGPTWTFYGGFSKEDWLALDKEQNRVMELEATRVADSIQQVERARIKAENERKTQRAKELLK